MGPPVLHRVGLAIFALLWALWGCEPKPADEACGGSEVCTSGQRCVGGVCRFTCGGNITCPQDLACLSDVCLPTNGGASSGAATSSGFIIITGSSSAGRSSSSVLNSAGGSSSQETLSSSTGVDSTGVTASSSSGGAVSSSSTSSSAGGVSSSGGGNSTSVGLSTSNASSLDGSSSAASSGGVTSSSLDCAAQARPCFTGTNTASGCTFTYACPNANQVCVAPNNTCMNYNYTPNPGTLPGGTCERKIVAEDQKAFMLCNIPGGWFVSNRQCAQLPGFQLASIDTLTQYNMLAQYLFSGDFWIGFTNRNDTDPPYVATPPSNNVTWVWLDQTPVTPGLGNLPGVFPWCNGQPDQNGERCAEWKSSGDCWNNKECGSDNPFICSR